MSLQHDTQSRTLSTRDRSVELQLGTYRAAKRAGLFELSWFRLLFQRVYFFYKLKFEDCFSDLTKRFPALFEDGHIIDVGANVGYTSLVFSRALTPGFKVFAFEPESENFSMLQDSVERLRISKHCQIFKAAVGARSGVCQLWLNESHHADHRVMTPSFSRLVDHDRTPMVDMVSIDEFLEKTNSGGQVSFVKIDVQGYELPVCEGMAETLRKNVGISVCFEYAPDHMRELGFEPAGVLRFFLARNFNLYAVQKGGKLAQIQSADVSAFTQKRPYFDILATRRKLV